MASSPSVGSWQVREDLSMTIEEFNHAANEMGMIAHRVLPPLPREEKSGRVPRRNLVDELADLDTRRNGDGTFNRSFAEFKDDTYSSEGHGLEALLDDEVQSRYDDLIDAEESEGNRIARAIIRRYERTVATYFTSDANYHASRIIKGLQAWTAANAGSSDPIGVIDEQREAFFADAGAEPNALVITRADLRAALKSDSILSRIASQNFQDTRPGVLHRSAEALATILDLDMVIVANALFNNSSTARNLARIWPTGKAVLCRVYAGDASDVHVGRTVVWSPMGAVDGDRLGMIAESYEEPQRMGSVQRRRTHYGLKIWHPECARLLYIDGTPAT